MVTNVHPMETAVSTKGLCFRVGSFRLGELLYDEALFDEEGNLYDKDSEGEYPECTIWIGPVRYDHCVLTIKARQVLRHRDELTLSVSATHNGKPLKLVKLRTSGYAIWRVIFPEGKGPKPTPRPRME